MQKIYLSFFALFLVVGANAQDFDFGKVSKEEVLEKNHPIYKDANAAVLYREETSFYDVNKTTGFTLITEVHERIKIYNKDGFDWATKKITTYKDGGTSENVSGLKAYTYNVVDGKLVEEKLRKKEIFEEEVNKYKERTTFTMPAVTEGSVIEYKYTISSPFVSSIDEMPLQYTIPINHLKLKVKIPEFWGYAMHLNPKSPLVYQIDQSKDNFTYNYTTTSRSGGTSFADGTTHSSFNNHQLRYLQNIYNISKENIPPLKQEVFVDYLQNYAAYIRWELQFTKYPNSTIENLSQTWEGVAKTIYNDEGYDSEMNKSGYFDKEVDALIAGVSNPLQKAQLIYDFVKSKVKWDNFVGYRPEHGAKSAFKDGEGNTGDINLLLLAMLKYAGLNAHPVLASTPDNGIPVFPTRKGFNYMLASIELPNQLILLDATSPTSAFGELPERARNWQGRILRERGSSAWVNLVPAYKSERHSTVNLTFADDLKLKGKSTEILNGLYAKSYRDKYLGENSEKYLETLEKNKGNIVISKLQTENKEKVGQDIKESYEFELENAVEVIDGKIYLKPLLFMALKENPFKADERYYPIFFDFPSSNEKVVNIMLPEGYQVESLPESAVLVFNNGAGKFQFYANQSGKFLRIQAITDMNQIVYPAQDYENLKKLYSQMVDKQNEVIVLSKA